MFPSYGVEVVFIAKKFLQTCLSELRKFSQCCCRHRCRNGACILRTIAYYFPTWQPAPQCRVEG